MVSSPERIGDNVSTHVNKQYHASFLKTRSKNAKKTRKVSDNNNIRKYGIDYDVDTLTSSMNDGSLSCYNENAQDAFAVLHEDLAKAMNKFSDRLCSSSDDVIRIDAANKTLAFITQAHYNIESLLSKSNALMTTSSVPVEEATVLCKNKENGRQNKTAAVASIPGEQSSRLDGMISVDTFERSDCTEFPGSDEPAENKASEHPCETPEEEQMRKELRKQKKKERLAAKRKSYSDAAAIAAGLGPLPPADAKPTKSILISSDNDCCSTRSRSRSVSFSSDIPEDNDDEIVGVKVNKPKVHNRRIKDSRSTPGTVQEDSYEIVSKRNYNKQTCKTPTKNKKGSNGLRNTY